MGEDVELPVDVSKLGELVSAELECPGVYYRTALATWTFEKRRCTDGNSAALVCYLFLGALLLLLEQVGILRTISTRYSQRIHGLLVFRQNRGR